MTDRDHETPTVDQICPPESERDAGPGWCDMCQNTGWIECMCGGDTCLCANNGVVVCPYCGGE